MLICRRRLDSFRPLNGIAAAKGEAYPAARFAAAVNIWMRIRTWLSPAASALSRFRDFLIDIDREPWKDTKVLGLAIGGRLVHQVDLRVTATHTVGSDPNCDVRLPSGPAVAAELSVAPQDDGVIFVPFWPDGRGGARRDAEARTLLDIGNSIEVAGYVLEIVDPRTPDERVHSMRSQWSRYVVRAWTWLVPINLWHPRQRRLLGVDFARIIGGGFAQRDMLLRKLGAIAYEAEAAVAEHQFATGRRAFVWCTFAFAVVCASVISSEPALGTSSAAAGAVALLLLTALICSIVSSAYGAAGASLYFGVAGALVGSFASRLEAGGPWGDTLFGFVFGVAGAAMGHQLEAAWFPVPNTIRAKQSGDVILVLAMAVLMPAPYEISRLEQVTRGTIAALDHRVDGDWLAPRPAAVPECQVLNHAGWLGLRTGRIAGDTGLADAAGRRMVLLATADAVPDRWCTARRCPARGVVKLGRRRPAACRASSRHRRRSRFADCLV